MDSNIVTKIIYKRKKTKIKFVKKLYTKIISLCGADIPESVRIGKNCSFHHNCIGSVIYDGTVLENNVRVYQNVTIGQSDPSTKNPSTFLIKEGAILCAGAKILGKNRIVVGKNTIVAANAVLVCSTGDNEVWGGIPAKKLKDRI